MTRTALWRGGLFAVLVLALVLRLHGIHDPILDHPGWRQGDTASIARNFALLQYNPLYPQTDYDGPPPNYVELELQIVPFLAATAYKVVGVHEIAGRLISIAFSLATILLIGFFARRIFGSALAGVFAALFFAIAPGSIYYGRTFMPDTAMIFFFTAALYAGSELLLQPGRWSRQQVAGATLLLALALLAKPVAIVAFVPIAALALERLLLKRPVSAAGTIVLFAVPLGVLYAYDRAVASHAEWLWTSGITQKHVLPALAGSFRSGAALHVKLIYFRAVLQMMIRTMLGPAITVLAALGFIILALPRDREWPVLSRTLPWSWLAGGLAYVYVVVTVERVDYYMYLLVPLAAIAAGGFAGRLAALIVQGAIRKPIRYAAAVAGILAVYAITHESRESIAPYYAYSAQVYRNAITLDRTLPRNALVVMAHYDPSILYYIGRFGWEEDPYLWTPFDEQSAIHKGARYFIAVEKSRFYRNIELCAWMQRFPVLNPNAPWPVYVTDPRLVKPGAERRWRAFRNAERAGRARSWLDAQRVCVTGAAAENPQAQIARPSPAPARPIPPAGGTR